MRGLFFLKSRTISYLALFGVIFTTLVLANLQPAQSNEDTLDVCVRNYSIESNQGKTKDGLPRVTSGINLGSIEVKSSGRLTVRIEVRQDCMKRADWRHGYRIRPSYWSWNNQEAPGNMKEVSYSEILLGNGWVRQEMILEPQNMSLSRGMVEDPYFFACLRGGENPTKQWNGMYSVRVLFPFISVNENSEKEFRAELGRIARSQMPAVITTPYVLDFDCESYSQQYFSICSKQTQNYAGLCSPWYNWIRYSRDSLTFQIPEESVEFKISGKKAVFGNREIKSAILGISFQKLIANRSLDTSKFEVWTDVGPFSNNGYSLKLESIKKFAQGLGYSESEDYWVGFSVRAVTNFNETSNHGWYGSMSSKELRGYSKEAKENKEKEQVAIINEMTLIISEYELMLKQLLKWSDIEGQIKLGNEILDLEKYYFWVTDVFLNPLKYLYVNEYTDSFQKDKELILANLELTRENYQRIQVVFDKSASSSTKKSTITCVKGKLTKKVTAVKPKCPSGYKKK